MAKSTKILVTGAGGFIDHHLVTFLKHQGFWVRRVDIKYPEFTPVDAHEFELLDLRRWEKLITERLCQHYREDYGLETRIVRFHNLFGPHGIWQGGREKAPAAFCRKIARAKLLGESEIEIIKKHVPGPMGVRGRNSDHTLLRKILLWEPQVSLEEGLASTHKWIEAQVSASLATNRQLAFSDVH